VPEISEPDYSECGQKTYRYLFEWGFLWGIWARIPITDNSGRSEPDFLLLWNALTSDKNLILLDNNTFFS
jgi:hypothetical protein